jgi:hypothetical protein
MKRVFSCMSTGALLYEREIAHPSDSAVIKIETCVSASEADGEKDKAAGRGMELVEIQFVVSAILHLAKIQFFRESSAAAYNPLFGQSFRSA